MFSKFKKDGGTGPAVGTSKATGLPQAATVTPINSVAAAAPKKSLMQANRGKPAEPAPVDKEKKRKERWARSSSSCTRRFWTTSTSAPSKRRPSRICGPRSTPSRPKRSTKWAWC
jgi:hypothetical protein